MPDTQAIIDDIDAINDNDWYLTNDFCFLKSSVLDGHIIIRLYMGDNFPTDAYSRPECLRPTLSFIPPLLSLWRVWDRKRIHDDTEAMPTLRATWNRDAMNRRCLDIVAPTSPQLQRHLWGIRGARETTWGPTEQRLLTRDKIVSRESTRKGFLVGIRGLLPLTYIIELDHVYIMAERDDPIRPGDRVTWQYRGHGARLRLPSDLQITRRTCGICHEDVATECISTCNHEYCADCIDRALERSNACPQCRRPIGRLLRAPLAIRITIHAPPLLWHQICQERTNLSERPRPIGVIKVPPGDHQHNSVPDDAPWDRFPRLDTLGRADRRLRNQPAHPVLSTTGYAYPLD
jgi:hypothetical protein